MAAYGKKTSEFSYADSLIKTSRIQEILWTFMPDGFEFEIEIINPLRATVKADRSCYYVRFVAESMCDCDNPKIRKGDRLLLQFPLRTWERALYAIPFQEKQNWNNLGTDNIYVKATRIRDSVLRIDKCERKEATEEQLAFAVEYY